MRDDLHRGALVPRVWRSFIRVAARDADWSVNGVKVAERAIQSLLSEFSSPLIREVEKLLTGRQLNLDPLLEVEQLRQRHQASTLESVLLDEVKACLKRPEYVFTPDFMSEELACVISEGCERFLRATALHIDQKAPESTKELLQRMRTLVNKVNLQERASLTVKGIRSQPISAKLPVHPDEALPLGEA